MPVTLTPPDVDVCMALGRLRAAPSSALYALSLRHHYKSERAARTRLSLLVDEKVLSHAPIAGTKKSIYFLNTAAFRLIPELATVASDNDRKPPTDPIAHWAHLRSTIYAALENDGFVVSADAEGLLVLKRHLLRAMKARITRASSSNPQPGQIARLTTTLARLEQSPALRVPTIATCRCEDAVYDPPSTTCSTCGVPYERKPHDPWTCSTCHRVSHEPAPHTARQPDGTVTSCAGIMRKRPLLPYAVARRDDQVWVVFIDHPYRALDEQLAELPARVPDQPAIEVLARASDDGSVFDSNTGAFRTTGPRHRALQRAFTPHDNPAVFPFWETVNVVQYRPELQHRVINRRSNHEEAA
jgi:hypothetical protein